jgi:hypothetical protein
MIAECVVPFLGGLVLALAVVGGKEGRLCEGCVLAWVGVGLALLLCGLVPGGAGLTTHRPSDTSAAALLALAVLYQLSFTTSSTLTRRFRRSLSPSLAMRLHVLAASYVARTWREAQIERWQVPGPPCLCAGDQCTRRLLRGAGPCPGRRPPGNSEWFLPPPP